MNAPSPNVMNKMQRCVLGLYSYDEHAEDLSLVWSYGLWCADYPDRDITCLSDNALLRQ